MFDRKLVQFIPRRRAKRGVEKDSWSGGKRKNKKYAIGPEQNGKKTLKFLL